MIVNAPGVLGILLAVLECAAGIVLVAAAARGLRALRPAPASGFAWEPFRHLLLLLVLLLATLAGVSLLVWVLLLQSCVPQWADVRCVVGVLRVGTGSAGTPGWLPALADATSALRAALLFAAGAAVAVHLAGRDRPEGPPSRRHLAALLAVGLLAAAGAATETAWVVIPKTGKLPPAGCCAPPGGIAAAAGPRSSADGASAADAALYAVPALLLGTGLALRRNGGGRAGAAWDLARAAAAGLLLAGGLRLVSAEVAPAALGLPRHRCTWCLVGEAPETLYGLALLAAPALAAGWLVAARRLGPGAGPTLGRIEGALDAATLFGLLGAPLYFAAARLAS